MFYRNYLKRILDFILSVLGIILLSPVYLVLIVLGVIIMKGNPFFLQPRPGIKKDGVETVFNLLKFRTMTNKHNGNGELLPDGERLTKYGRFLRETSLDELPELFNIVKGDMAIVGPRPQLVRDMTFMTKEQRRRHEVRPGLTGLAQVSGRNNVNWIKKFELDLVYIENINFNDDVKLFFKTFSEILKKEDVAREGTDTDIDFGDYLLEENLVTKEQYDKNQKEASKILQEFYNGKI